MAKESIYKNPSTEILELLLSIQADFQQQVYKAIAPYPKQFQEEILSGVHILFQRFYFSTIDSKKQLPSPYDIVANEVDRKHIIIPDEHELMILLFRSPIKQASPNRRIRMHIGIDTWTKLPIAVNVHKRNSRLFFPKDEIYKKLVEKVDTKKSPHVFFQEVLIKTLEMWRQKDSMLSETFTKDSWLTLWKEYLKDASKSWVSTDDIFTLLFRQFKKAGLPVDLFINALNGNYPEEDLLNGREKFLEYIKFFRLTSNYAAYFLIPFSLYFPVLTLSYIDPIDIVQEIDEYSGVFPNESFCNWVTKPSSEFQLNTLGKGILSELKW